MGLTEETIDLPLSWLVWRGTSSMVSASGYSGMLALTVCASTSAALFTFRGYRVTSHVRNRHPS